MSFLSNKLSGFRDSLAFSNRWPLIFQRLLRPHDPIVTYGWRGRWWLVCDARVQDNSAPKEVLANGCYDEWIRRSIRDGSLAYVNVGANIGAFDLAVASAAAIPFALGIELNPDTFTRLNFNLAINDLRQVVTLNVGLAGRAGTFRFSSSNCSLADSLFAAPGAAADPAARAIPLLTLEAALESAGFADREFDLLKLDCEAAEYGIVSTAPIEVLRRFRHVVIELHPVPEGETLGALSSRFEAAGFRAETVLPGAIEQASLHFWKRLETSPARA